MLSIIGITISQPTTTFLRRKQKKILKYYKMKALFKISKSNQKNVTIVL